MNNEKKERDISEEKRMQATRSRLAAIVESSDDAIVGKTLNGVIISWNAGAEKMYGYKAREVIGKNVSILVPPEHFEELSGIYERIRRGEHLEHFETVRIRKDGAKVTVSLSVSPIKDDSGNITGASAIARDITEQKRHEGRIREASEEWVRTFNSISDLLFIADKNHTIIRANKACLDILKLKPEEVVGKKCYEIMHRRTSPWPECPMERTRIDKNIHTQEVNDSAIGIPLLVTTSPILNDKGELVGVVHLARDISDRKKFETELMKKIDELERFRKITVGRELRMKELKAKITELENRLGGRQNG